MAKVDVLHTPKDGSFLFYNLDAGVGKGGVNRNVVLVAELRRRHPNASASIFAPP